MNIVTRFLALGALAAASLTQGCGCSGDNNNNGNTIVEPPPVETPTVDISGTAMKGVVGGGVVSAFTLDNKGVIAAQPFKTAVTDALGKYTIKIPETYIGKPISFRITPAANTQLTCDLDIGCGTGIAFGTKYPLPSSSKLVLETLVPALDKTKNVNVSTFSTLAAEQARKALASNADINALGAAIKKASGEVANMFGLTGELSELELLDITNKDAVKAAVDAGKTEVLRVGALNAAIISASQSANPGFTLEQALTKLAADITTKGIASNSSDSTVADLTKILTSVSNILSQVKNLNATGVDLTALITSVANDLGRVRNEPVDVYNPGTVVPPAELDVKALAFANVVRELINGGDIVLDTKVGDSSVKTKGEKFRAQLEAAEMLNGDHVDALGKGLSVAAEAIAEAADAYHYDNTLRSYTAGEVKVTIAPAEATPKVDYSVEQTINGVAVKLMASDTHTETTTGAVETAVGKLELSGSAADSAVKLSVLTGSMLEAGKLTRETKDGVEISTLEGLKLLLKTDVAQLQVGEVTDPVSVSGWLKFEFGTFTRAVGSNPTTKGVLGISFEGTVKNTTGESVALALNIAGDTKGLTFDELAAGVDPIDTEVTEDKFNNLYAALSFNAQLNSQSSAATVKLMTTRESVSATRVSLDLLFGAHNLRFSSSIARLASQPYNLSIANQDRLVMSLTQATEGGDVTGSIKAPDGVKVLAEITKSDLCAVKVTRKTDGEIVCLIDVR